MFAEYIKYNKTENERDSRKAASFFNQMLLQYN